MALTDESGSNMVLPVQPMGNGNGGWGGDWGSWIILFLIFGMFGGWGNGGFGGYGGFNGGLSYDFPWLLNANNNTDAIVSNGFTNMATQNALTGIQSSITSGFGDVQLGLAGINQNICQTGNGIVNSITQSQIANMQSANAMQSQLANCCCENRLATANLSALVQSENCADRAALSDGIRDIIQSQTSGTQRILDQLCADKIDAKNERIAELQNQLTLANLAASQNAQTAAILANNDAQTAALEQYLAPVPRPAYIVQNPNCCANTCGCSFS